MPEQRRCPAPECDAAIPSERFACRYHWYMLPSRMREAINRAFAEWTDDIRNVAALRQLKVEQAKAAAELKRQHRAKVAL